ncbi:conserved Plasmodium protein, unknown function [Plasmodium ovale curtisi]|uniref:Cytochrome b-c1 complex subunit 9 n=1 Tax=Plasmodium ovale curtisi TaxID=864141 RepID=A0A1A8VXP9_PLAOA|nr:conserved Plasmodium protein, unknown function [Plasmodium ovale curtisi]SBS94293.1 conserved Plasmodium protein, unknown function [Plasmodium ovale curtisi]
MSDVKCTNAEAQKCMDVELRCYDALNPFSDTYPSFIWKVLGKSRKGKDIFNPFFVALNKTKIYDHILKHNSRYWLFVVTGGCVTSYFWGIWFNNMWKRINKGKLYIDCPYTYPEED